MSETENKQRESTTGKKPARGKHRAVQALQITGLVLALVILAALLVNALLGVFMKHYYPTFGKYRLFAVVTDSMEPEIPEGNLIVSRKPTSQDEIQVGTVITFEVRQGKSVTLLTHRVTAINRNESTGAITYTTRGDNAGGVDAVRPSYSDVVGIYTGKRCAGLGYVMGFLQSAEGAIALILIVMIGLIAYIVVRFVNLVNIWRGIAVEALKKSGALLADTHNEDLGTIADVIGIAVKDPADKKDARRKDKKLKWFLKTGMLPRRPYSDDLEEDAPFAGGHKIVLPEPAPAPLPAPVSAQESAAVRYVSEPFESMRYVYSYTARLIRMGREQKERYSQLKNELLSYGKVRAKASSRGERFSLGRKTVARFTVRGKTLCLALPLDPAAYQGTPYAMRPINGGQWGVYRISSNRRVKYARKLIADAMESVGGAKNPAYEPQDYYLPYEGVLSLLQRGLVKRDLRTQTKTFRIEEVPEPPLSVAE